MANEFSTPLGTRSMWIRNTLAAALASALCGQAYAGDMVIVPTPEISAGIVAGSSSTSEASHVVCTTGTNGLAGCNLYSLYVTTGASAGFLMTFNASSAPVDGAVTPVDCVPAAANSATALSNSGEPPTRFRTGLVVVFSTTGCFTKTGSATAFFRWKIQ